jgi:hypothetical protein
MNMPVTPASASPGPGKQQSSLAAELDKLIDDARKRAKITHSYELFWQGLDAIFGLLAAVLAAIAGAAGLASTAGRIPAAILALCAAGFAAANQFLGSGERYERNRRCGNAWEVLEWDACAERAKLGEPSVKSLDVVMSELFQRRIAIMDMDHRAIPPNALSSPGS